MNIVINFLWEMNKLEKEVYEAPEVEVIEFETEDVMVISGPEVPLG